MYMNKNKGFSLIETMICVIAVSIILQIAYFYLKILNKEKQNILHRIGIQTKLQPLIKTIELSLYEGLSYKIYNNNFILKNIDYKKNGVQTGNILVIKQYEPNNSYRAIIFYNLNSSMIINRCDLSDNDVISVSICGNEKILDNINVLFKEKEYGISMEGKYRYERFKKEFKK